MRAGECQSPTDAGHDGWGKRVDGIPHQLILHTFLLPDPNRDKSIRSIKLIRIIIVNVDAGICLYEVQRCLNSPWKQHAAKIAVPEVVQDRNGKIGVGEVIAVFLR